MAFENVNTQALLNLASSKVQEALLAIGGTINPSSSVQASMLRQATEQTQRDIDAAAGEILKLKRNKQEFLVNLATYNVSLQTQIDNNNALATSANLADQYGDHTDNYLPLQKIIGGAVPSGDKSLIKVPDGWVAPAVATAA